MRYIFTLAFIIFMIVDLHAQQVSYVPQPIPAPTTPVAALFDSYGGSSSKEEKTKLKKFAAETKLKKDEYMMKYSQLYILSYGGRRTYSDEALKRANRAKRYLVEKQGLEPERISIIDSGYRENWEIELYFVPPGAVPPNPDPTLDADDVRIYEAKRKKRKQRVKQPLAPT